MITPSAAYLAEHNTQSRTPIYAITLTEPSSESVDSLLSADSDLAAGYNLDETSSTRFDITSNNQDLTPTNTPSYVAGKIGNALALVKTSSQQVSKTVAPTDTLYIGDINFCISTWVQLTSKPAGGMILASQYGTVFNRVWALYWDDSTDRFVFLVNNSASTQETISATNFGPPTVGVWYYILAWRDATSKTIYISVNNGTPNSYTGAITLVASSAESFRIGGWNASGGGGDTFWNGYVDQFYIFRRLLTATEKSFIYSNGDGIDISTEISAADALATYNFCTHTSPFSGTDLGPDILQPISLEKRVDPEFCRFPLSEFIFDLHTNTDDDALTAISGGIVGWRVDFQAGFRDIAWASNYIQLFSGIISDFEYKGGVFHVTARSTLARANNVFLFSGAQSTLSSAISDSATTLPLTSTIAFDDAFSSPQSAWRLVLIDNEIITYRAKTAAALTSCVRVTTFPFWVPPAFPGSESVAHSASSPVRELPDLGRLTGSNDETIGTNDMHPMDFLTSILTDSDQKRALNINDIQVDATNIAAVRTALGDGLRFRFIFYEAVSGKNFIEEDFYLPIGSYPTENNMGEIGMKLYRSVDNFAHDGDIDDEHIIDFPQWIGNAEKLINTVVYKYDYNPLTKEFANSYIYRDEDLISEQGAERQLVIYSKGIRSYFTGSSLTWFSSTAAFLAAASARHIARFGNSAPIIKVQTVFNRNLIEVGDDVECNFINAVDIAGNDTTITNGEFEVIGMLHDFEKSIINFDLLGYYTSPENAPAGANDVALDKYMWNMSRVVRRKIPGRFGYTIDMKHLLDAGTQPINADKWIGYGSRIVLRKLGGKYQFATDITVPAPPETITVDKWLVPFSRVVLRKVRGRHAIVEDYTQPAVAETVTSDKWSTPFSRVVRRKKEEPIRAYTRVVMEEADPGTSANWYASTGRQLPVRYPIRQRPRIMVAADVVG